MPVYLPVLLTTCLITEHTLFPSLTPAPIVNARKKTLLHPTAVRNINAQRAAEATEATFASKELGKKMFHFIIPSIGLSEDLIAPLQHLVLTQDAPNTLIMDV